jgi:basic membrane protein A
MKVSFGKKLLVLAAAFILAAGGAAFAGGSKDKGASGAASGQLKIALLMPGPINDGGWNTMAYNALMEAKNSLGAEVGYTENVKLNDTRQLVRQYATRGYNVIIGHGNEFTDPFNEVGDEFPNVCFLNYGGQAKNGKNVGAIQYFSGQTGALLGVLAGMSGVTKVGVIGAFEQPTSQQEYLNIERYAKKYNPNIQFSYTYTNDWDDIAKGREATIALLNNGCQLIYSDLSGPAGAVANAVKDKNALFMQGTFDGYDLAPQNIVSSGVADATKATLAALRLIQEGKFTGTVYRFGLKEDVMFMGKYGPSVTDAMKAEVEKVKKDISEGRGDLLILNKD